MAERRSWKSELRILYHLLRPVRGATHAERMERFYAGQASAYDDFRARLLHGRQTLLERLAPQPGEVWIDLGGGTGGNLECVAECIPQMTRIDIVDLAPSLLAEARRRSAHHGWSNVELHCADATTFRPKTKANIVTFSYALTMMPNWYSAVDHAASLLQPGGRIGVVDFYVSQKFPSSGRQRHGWLTRSLWPLWFAHDNVYLSADHLPYLETRFETMSCLESRGKVPYLCGLTVPYYCFVGKSVGER